MLSSGDSNVIHSGANTSHDHNSKGVIILCILDGLGDHPVEELGDRTPLELAKTPVLDLLTGTFMCNDILFACIQFSHCAKPKICSSHLYTPLVAHHWSHIFTEHGLVGLMDPVEPGLACGSDTAHLSILGYDPRLYYDGRGAFESIGAGLEMEPGDLAFKSIFSYIEDISMDKEAEGEQEQEEEGKHNSAQSDASKHTRTIVVRRRCATDFRDWGVCLCEALCTLDPENGHHSGELKLPEEFSDVSVVVRYATEHRCGVRIRSSLGALSDAITGTDPLRDGLPIQESRPVISSDMSESARQTAERTARICNAVSKEFRRILTQHPICTQRLKDNLPSTNIVLLRGGAACPELPSFYDRTRRRACYVAPTAVISGLLRSLGFHRIEPTSPGANGEVDSNLMSKAEALAAAFGWAESDGNGRMSPTAKPTSLRFDFGLFHVKGTDEASHEGEPLVKAQVIERFDAALYALLQYYAKHAAADVDNTLPPLTIAVTGDHTTACGIRDHVSDPVPFVAARITPTILQKLLLISTTSAPSEPSTSAGADSIESSYKFCERTVKARSISPTSGLGRFPGQEVVKLLLQMDSM